MRTVIGKEENFYNRPRLKASIVFAPKEIEKLEKRGRIGVLKRVGAYVRKAIQNSLKFRRDPWVKSKPGTPPYWHTPQGAHGMNLRSSILFEADQFSVAVGPMAYRWKDIGGLHEFGGMGQVKAIEKKFTDRVFKVGEIGPIAEGKFASRISQSRIRESKYVDPLTRAKVIMVPLTSQKMANHATKLKNRIISMQKGRFKVMGKFPARPFVGPAFNRSKPHLAEFWRGAITT